VIHVAVYTGLRRGELFGLQWGDVDWGNGTDGGRLWIRRSIYHGATTSPKTPNSVRIVDVPQRTLNELAMYRMGFPPVGEGFIFRTAAGTPMDGDNWTKRAFLPIVEKAKLRRIGLHTLRHTYASLLINAGESIKYVSKQMGHASIQITGDLYAHLFRETSLAAMRRLGEQIPEHREVPSNIHLTERAEAVRTGSNRMEHRPS
jgi:integrase